MRKKIICAGLILAGLLETLPALPLNTFAAESGQNGYIEVAVNGTVKHYPAVAADNTVYLNAEDISEITGYELDIGDDIAYVKAGGLDSVTAVTIDFDGRVQTMGRNYEVGIIRDGNDVYLPLNQMFCLLHAQWCTDGGLVAVQPLPDTIIDFLGSERYADMWANKVNHTDLLMNGESDAAHNIRSTLAAVFNDFDPMIFALWWPEEGFYPAINKGYETALLQLAVDDQYFLNDRIQNNIEAELQKVNRGSMKNDVENLKNVLEVPDNLIQGADQIDQVAEWIQNASAGHPSIRFSEWNEIDLSHIAVPQMQALAQELGAAADFMDIANVVMKTSEVSQRSQKWGQDFLNQISVLTDFNDAGYHTSVTDRVRTVASGLIEEYEDPIQAAANEAALRSVSLFCGKIFDESLFGKYFSIFNAGLSVSKMNSEVRDSIDGADLAYMVDFLIKIEHIALNEMNRSYSRLLANQTTGNLTEQDISRLRNSVMLSLRANLRNHAFLYYLNEKLNGDPNWNTSMQAREIEDAITSDYIMLCEVMETESTDKMILLPDFGHMDSEEYGMVRQTVTLDVFHEGEVPPEQIDVPAACIRFLNTGGYMPYLADWVFGSPAEYALLDLDGDGTEELILSGGDDMGFYSFMVFDCDPVSGAMTPVCIPELEPYGNGTAPYSGNYFGALMYSPAHHALVYTETNDGIMYGRWNYRVLDGQNLPISFDLSFETDYGTDQTVYTSTESGQREPISEDAFYAYQDEAESLEFHPLPALHG